MRDIRQIISIIMLDRREINSHKLQSLLWETVGWSIWNGMVIKQDNWAYAGWRLAEGAQQDD